MGSRVRICAIIIYAMSYRGEVHEAFKSMKVSRAMRLSWLKLWQSMDKDGSNLLDYQEFVAACGLTDGLWSWRVFNLLDKNCTGRHIVASRTADFFARAILYMR